MKGRLGKAQHLLFLAVGDINGNDSIPHRRIVGRISRQNIERFSVWRQRCNTRPKSISLDHVLKFAALDINRVPGTVLGTIGRNQACEETRGILRPARWPWAKSNMLPEFFIASFERPEHQDESIPLFMSRERQCLSVRRPRWVYPYKGFYNSGLACRHQLRNRDLFDTVCGLNIGVGTGARQPKRRDVS